MDAVKLAPVRRGVPRAEPIEVVAEVLPQPTARVELKVEIVAPAQEQREASLHAPRAPELPPPSAARDVPANPARAAAAYVRQSERPPRVGLVVDERV